MEEHTQSSVAQLHLAADLAVCQERGKGSICPGPPIFSPFSSWLWVVVERSRRRRQQTDFKPTENAAAWDAPGDGESTRLRGSSEPVLSGLRGGRRSYSGRAGNRPIQTQQKC